MTLRRRTKASKDTPGDREDITQVGSAPVSSRKPDAEVPESLPAPVSDSTGLKSLADESEQNDSAEGDAPSLPSVSHGKKPPRVKLIVRPPPEQD